MVDKMEEVATETEIFGQSLDEEVVMKAKMGNVFA